MTDQLVVFFKDDGTGRIEMDIKYAYSEEKHIKEAVSDCRVVGFCFASSEKQSKNDLNAVPKTIIGQAVSLKDITEFYDSPQTSEKLEEYGAVAGVLLQSGLWFPVRLGDIVLDRASEKTTFIADPSRPTMWTEHARHFMTALPTYKQ